MKNRNLIIYSIITIIFLITLFVIKHINDFENKYVNISEKILFQEALSLYNNMNNSIQWLSNYDKIQAIKDGTVQDIHSATLINQINKTLNSEGHYKLSITSLNPINPKNKPDAFEKKALLQLQENYEKFYTNFQGEKYNFFGILQVSQSCLKCHNANNYKVGDTIGGLRISIPTYIYDNNIEIIKEETKHLYLITILIAIIFIFIITITLNNLYKKEHNTRKINKILAKKVDKRTKELSLLNEQLEKSASIDYLTNIPNRRFFFQASQKCFHLSCREEKVFSVICIDIDYFKKINDTYGHQIGDEILKLTASSLEQTIRKSDVVARIGGEEFVVLLQNTNLENAVNLAEKLRKKIEKIDFNGIKFTISLGVNEIDFIYDRNMEAVIAKADEALYKAKENGRNRVETLKQR